MHGNISQKYEKELHANTWNYIKNTAPEKRKKYGQYFTLKSIREKLLSNLPDSLFHKKNIKILDPACGTGEFLLSCKKMFDYPVLEGWEFDEVLLNISKKLIPEAKLVLTDSLLNETSDKYDLIVGNPPYFEFKPDERIKKEYDEVINGRTNIYSLFIYRSLKLLKKGGYLAFVNPPSMNNGAYFSALRRYIVDNSSIEFLHMLDDPMMFDGAIQSVMLMILKKGEKSEKYIFKRGNKIIFSRNATFLKEQFENRITLKEMGYTVKTGRIIWNENKNKLTDEQYIPLIWSHNITMNGIKLNNKPGKKQYIKCDSYDEGPAIVVNRIVGQPGKGKIKAAIIPPKMKFVAENHVNVIFPPEKSYTENEKNITIPSIENIVEQLNSPEKLEILREITGNTQISKTELYELFPFEVPCIKEKKD